MKAGCDRRGTGWNSEPGYEAEDVAFDDWLIDAQKKTKLCSLHDAGVW